MELEDFIKAMGYELTEHQKEMLKAIESEEPVLLCHARLTGKNYVFKLWEEYKNRRIK